MTPISIGQKKRTKISKYMLQKEDGEQSAGSQQDIVTKACGDNRNKPVDYIKVAVFLHYITISFSNMTSVLLRSNIPATRRHSSANGTTINTQNSTQTNLATRYRLRKNLLQFVEVGKHLQQLLVFIVSK
jgi:hypothetical protein